MNTKKYLVVESIAAFMLVIGVMMTAYAQVPSRGVVAQPIDTWARQCATRVGQAGTPYIQVLSPNGGEVYQPGDQVTVTWRMCNVNPSSQLLVHLGPSTEQTFVDFTTTVGASRGSTILTIPSDLDTLFPNFAYGRNYRAFVQSGATVDQSDDLITVNPASSSSSVNGATVCNAQLLYPHSGQEFNIEDHATPSGDMIQVDVFLKVTAGSQNGCVWSTTGSLIPTANPNAGGAGLVDILPVGATRLTGGRPLNILGNLNFGVPSAGDRIYHQKVYFSESSQPEGTYTIQLEESNNAGVIGDKISVPIKVEY